MNKLTSNLQLTLHAARRCRQRALTTSTIEAVVQHGRRTFQKDGCCRYVLTSRQVINLAGKLHPKPRDLLLSKSQPVFVLCDATTGCVITAGYQLRRVKDGPR